MRSVLLALPASGAPPSTDAERTPGTPRERVEESRHERRRVARAECAPRTESPRTSARGPARRRDPTWRIRRKLSTSSPAVTTQQHREGRLDSDDEAARRRTAQGERAPRDGSRAPGDPTTEVDAERAGDERQCDEQRRHDPAEPPRRPAPPIRTQACRTAPGCRRSSVALQTLAGGPTRALAA